jgi:hypothetical protein
MIKKCIIASLLLTFIGMFLIALLSVKQMSITHYIDGWNDGEAKKDED